MNPSVSKSLLRIILALEWVNIAYFSSSHIRFFSVLTIERKFFDPQTKTEITFTTGLRHVQRALRDKQLSSIRPNDYKRLNEN